MTFSKVSGTGPKKEEEQKAGNLHERYVDQLPWFNLRIKVTDFLLNIDSI